MLPLCDYITIHVPYPVSYTHLDVYKRQDYLVTGNFSNLAAKEAAKYGEVNIVASSKDKNLSLIHI